MQTAVFRTAAIGFGLAVSSFLWIGSVGAQERDRNVCYRTLEYDNGYTRVVLNVRFHSNLPSSRGSQPQGVYEADGKHAFLDSGRNRMAVMDGAVVVSYGDGYQPRGAHMGLESIWSAAPA